MIAVELSEHVLHRAGVVDEGGMLEGKVMELVLKLRTRNSKAHQ